MAVGQELLDVPFPDMIKGMGLAIAQAQMEIDLVSIRLAQVMAGQDVKDETDPSKTVIRAQLVKFDGKDYSLLELGFTPTFYQFVDTIIEVKISVSVKTSSESSRSNSTYNGSFEGTFLGFYNKGSVSATSVSATFASKYQYSSEGSSLLRTKLVPVPPPTILQERIRKVIEARNPPS